MMTPEQAVAKLATARSLPAFILCFGDEPQRIMSTIDATLAKAKTLGYSEHLLIVIEQIADWEHLWMLYQEQSLFASTRVVQVIFNTKINAAQSEKLQALIDHPNPDIILLLRTAEMDKYAIEAKWLKAIDRVGWVVQSRVLTDRALNTWLIDEAQQLGMSMTESAVATLATWSEGNLVAARQSLLRWQLQGITLVDDTVIALDRQDWARYDIFALSEKIIAQDVVNAQRILSRLMDSGEEIVLLLWVVSRELRVIQSIRATMQQKSWSQLCSEHRLWGTRASSMQQFVKQLDSVRLDKWHKLALTIDLQIKGQMHGDAWMSLQWLVMDMASKGKRLLEA